MAAYGTIDVSQDLAALAYEQYAERVRSFIAGKVHDAVLADDLCSIVFVKVCERYHTYDSSKAAFSTWIFTIARNVVIDHYRSCRVQVELPEEIESSESVVEEVCNNETLEELARALQKLDERERQIIVKRYYHGETMKGIASDLGISYSYAKVLHKQALATLKAELS